MKTVDDINAARLAHASELGELRKLLQDLADAEARATTAREQHDGLAVERAHDRLGADLMGPGKHVPGVENARGTGGVHEQPP